jgi:CubicO group peptidase (beta-lactamase class C family)
MKLKSVCIGLALLAFGLCSQAQGLSQKQLDSLVEKTLSTFNVPGISLAVIKDGKVIHSKGYGIRSIKNQKPTDENTLFGVASNTKAMTAALLGMLVDEKKLSWDSKVTDFIPEFKLYDPYVTNEFTIRDLLTHRSGLGLGAGDLMIWPDSSSVSKQQLIHNLRYLKPVSSFRSKYDYDNLLYIVAGVVVERASGMSYEDFLENRIFKPLGMNKTAASWYRLKDRTNIIDGHAPYLGKLLAVGLSFTEIANAAGGVYSNVVDMSKWVTAMLNGGRYGEKLEKRLFSEAVARELWTPQTIINGGGAQGAFVSYGLGWNLSNVYGTFQASHTGGLSGIVTQVIMLPQKQLGIIVLTNQQSGAAFTAISTTIKDAYLGIKGIDRIKMYNDIRLNQERNADKIIQKINEELNANTGAKSNIDLSNYVAKFKDNWFGEVNIRLEKNGLYFQAKNSPKLQGKMTFYKGTTFIVRWNDRSLDADAFVNFKLNNEGKAAGFTIEAISPLTDFSFDFQDLDFNAVK